MTPTDGVLGASFRDPSGFLFRRDGIVYRQVDASYADDYAALMASGLYEKLTSKGLLIPHEEVTLEPEVAEGHHKTLRPEQLAFVSYPYEWSFSQLKDAALLTLRIQRLALACDLSLKDASAYNVQFHRGGPTFIDTLSFERHREGEPWVGYRQFCQHFLAPLALMSLRDVRLAQLLRVHLDGIPLDLATSLLPRRAWLRLGLLTHLRLHARYQQRFDQAGAEAKREATEATRGRPLTKTQLSNLVRDLESTVKKLDWKPAGTEWADYYEGDSYEEASLAHKRERVASFVTRLAPRQVFDLGANTGLYSRIASEQGADVVSFDVDPACVERNYREVRQRKEERVLPLLLDLVNPSPALGFANDERSAFVRRGEPDVILALALVHHIAISNNVPLPRIAAFLAALAPGLVIEFVPKGDAKVDTLLATREDVFPDYTRDGFEAAFRGHFEILEAVAIRGSTRTLYCMRRR